jgi:hypothetical protein
MFIYSEKQNEEKKDKDSENTEKEEKKLTPAEYRRTQGYNTYH